MCKHPTACLQFHVLYFCYLYGFCDFFWTFVSSCLSQRAYAKKKGRNNVTVDDLVHVITPKGRGESSLLNLFILLFEIVSSNLQLLMFIGEKLCISITSNFAICTSDIKKLFQQCSLFYYPSNFQCNEKSCKWLNKLNRSWTLNNMVVNDGFCWLLVEFMSSFIFSFLI